MKKSYWLFLFILVLAAEEAAIAWSNEILQFVCKPLLLVFLAIYFFEQTKQTGNGLKKWVFAALFFSWTGDILLLFQQKNSIFFLLGLSAFLIAHIFYIILFHAIRVKEGIRGNAWFLLLVVIYYAILVTILSPHLGTMKLPVRIYGIFISFMFMLSMHLLSIRDKRAGRWIFAGAFLFVASDSILAIDKFYQSFQPAGLLIMLTYGLAQLFIVTGAIRYTRSANSN